MQRAHGGSCERKKHRGLLAAAIHKCEQKKSTANALTVMYDLNDLGRHIDPGAKEDGVCANLVDHLIGNNPRVEPARGALIAFLEMGPSERTHGWFPRQFDHGVFLLGEPIKKAAPSKPTSPGSPQKRRCGQHDARCYTLGGHPVSRHERWPKTNTLKS